MSTEAATGATPASFSAHASDRNNASEIGMSQIKLRENFDTKIICDFNYYDQAGVSDIQTKVNNTLYELSPRGYYTLLRALAWLNLIKMQIPFMRVLTH